MTNIEKYNQAFIDAFNVTNKELADLRYKSIPAWDSVGHMTLIANIEENFDIMIESDDIIDISSYTHGKEILNKYNISF